MFLGSVSLWNGAELSIAVKQVDESDGKSSGDGTEHEVEVEVILELVINPSGWPQSHRISAVSDLRLEDGLGIENPSQGAEHAHFSLI